MLSVKKEKSIFYANISSTDVLADLNQQFYLP